ncbi:hypothetical protein OG559_31145 (plasmid) [Micromonospora sp. NBC_01405]|uniref:hypothetical protein n=1 Tax=Micromonospora sp. NBC_01405 TaxID=2903589 RepID=UPI003250EE47
MSIATVDQDESAVTAEEINAEPQLTKAGTVRKKPGPKPGSKRAPRTAPAPGKAAAPRPKSAGGVDYRPAITGILQIPQMILGMLGRFTKRPALQLDGLTVGIHAPVIAEALNETARTEQAVASALDRLMVAGPYGLVIAATLPALMQVLANHEVIEPNPQMGTYAPEQLAELGNMQAAAVLQAAAS